MKYAKPTIIASYSERELIADAAVCTGYHGGGDWDWWNWWK
jgi:hypothetical protein